MKTLNRENYEAWVLEAFDFNELKKKEDLEDEDGDFYWNKDYELDELTIGDGLVYRSIGVHEFGLDIELWKYEDKGKVQKKNHIEKLVRVPIRDSDLNYYLLRFIPENIPDLQKEAEEWLELEARISLKDWLESEN